MMMTDHDLVMVVCNCPPEHAHRLARGLVERRLSSCVNILPSIQSVYRWEGEVCEDNESTLLIKTSSQHIDFIDEFMIKEHPYDVHELIQLDVQAVNASYAAWSKEQVS